MKQDTTSKADSAPEQRSFLTGRTLLGFSVLGTVAFGSTVVLATGEFGVVEVEPSQVAVVVDYLAGTTRTAEESGYRFHIPWLQEVFLLDRSPMTFRMGGEEAGTAAPQLTVRAKDGSNFWFESLEVGYRLIPSEAPLVMGESGPGRSINDGWVPAFARSVLRDEYGRFAANEAADASLAEGAQVRALARLGAALVPHGIQVTLISSPKPKFDRTYEKAIGDRKVANQEVARIEAQVEQILRQRDQRMAELEKEKEIEMVALRGELAANALMLEQQEIKARSQSNAYRIEREGKGRVRRSELLAEARRIAEKSARVLQSSVSSYEVLAALDRGGEVAVRAALIERLETFEITLEPVSAGEANDPANNSANNSANKGDS